MRAKTIFFVPTVSSPRVVCFCLPTDSSREERCELAFAATKEKIFSPFRSQGLQAFGTYEKSGGYNKTGLS
jgi:hypothetical protein